ncbi:MAG: Hint domain-containing protein [Fimbriiglobus sp.]
MRAGDFVWSYRFEAGGWVLARVAAHRTSTYHGTITDLHTSGGIIEATGAHPVWVVRGIGLMSRPPCEELTPFEDQRRTLDGRWVRAEDVRPGDVVYGRDSQHIDILKAESRDVTAEVCTLSIDGHPNFAVGADGVLAHNEACWKELLEKATGRPVPPAQAANPAFKGKIHGHHIVMKTVPNDVRGPFIDGAQKILKKYESYGLSVLGTKDEVKALIAAGKKVETPNLCYAANGFDEIHSEKYCKAVYDRLVAAEKRGITDAQKAAEIKVELRAMADIMEDGKSFWN